MPSKLPGDIKSQISEANGYNVNANRKHRDVTREMNNKKDGMANLRREDAGRDSNVGGKK